MTSPELKRREVTPGRETHREGVSRDGRGGAVVVRVGDALRVTQRAEGQREERTLLDLENAMSIRFDGEGADRCHWVQFLWIEVVLEDGPSNPPVDRRIPGQVPTSGGRVELTTSPGDPKVSVDGDPDPTGSPAYDEGGGEGAEVNGGRCMIWDQPDAATALTLASGHVRPDTVAVRVVFHFTSYLVRDGVVLYTLRWIARARWDFNLPPRPEDVPVDYEVEGGMPGGAPSDAERRALDREHPGQDVLP